MPVKCRCGGTGRRTGLKILRLNKPCRFDSGHLHHKKDLVSTTLSPFCNTKAPGSKRRFPSFEPVRSRPKRRIKQSGGLFYRRGSACSGHLHQNIRLEIKFLICIFLHLLILLYFDLLFVALSKLQLQKCSFPHSLKKIIPLLFVAKDFFLYELFFLPQFSFY